MVVQKIKFYLNIYLLGSIFTSFSAYSNNEHPTFSDFKVNQKAHKTVQSIDFDSHPDGVFIGQKWQGNLDTIIGQPANFAGHYFVMGTGCGTACQLNIIVDVHTGKIVDSINSSLGLCYQAESALLIVNPRLDGYGETIPEWAFSYYYHLENGNVTLLEKTKKGYSGFCEFGQ